LHDALPIWLSDRGVERRLKRGREGGGTGSRIFLAPIEAEGSRIGLTEKEGFGAAQSAAIGGDEGTEEGTRCPVIAQDGAGVWARLRVGPCAADIEVAPRTEDHAERVDQPAAAGGDEGTEEGPRVWPGRALKTQDATPVQAVRHI